MKIPKDILGPMRPPFLILAPACALLGIGTAFWTSDQIKPLHIVLVLIGAVSAHVSVNALNEFFDFRSGLDTRTQRTPFSGGSGTLPGKPEMERSALYTGLIALLITALVGVYFLLIWGLSLLPLGILGLVTIVLYTTWFTRNSWLCLVAPGLGFGILMVMGSYFALTGHYSWEAFIASLVPFFLVSDLLLLNQFPDVEADRSIGRQHFPITIGAHASSYIYTAFLFLAYLSILSGVVLGYLPRASLLGLATLLFAVPAAMGAIRYSNQPKELLPAMGMNVAVSVFTPVLIAIGLLISA